MLAAISLHDVTALHVSESLSKNSKNKTKDIVRNSLIKPVLVVTLN